jgi:hypothetical protein
MTTLSSFTGWLSKLLWQHFYILGFVIRDGDQIFKRKKTKKVKRVVLLSTDQKKLARKAFNKKRNENVSIISVAISKSRTEKQRLTSKIQKLSVNF